ncbi:hypothetical protein BLOT_009123 [Blomia tropicalis]|nr:hypothetical protein BLOT_009123 [Blomia tropicalis]
MSISLLTVANPKSDNTNIGSECSLFRTSTATKDDIMATLLGAYCWDLNKIPYKFSEYLLAKTSHLIMIKLTTEPQIVPQIYILKLTIYLNGNCTSYNIMNNDFNVLRSSKNVNVNEIANGRELMYICVRVNEPE